MNQQLLLDIFPIPKPTLANYLPGPNYEAYCSMQMLQPGRAVYLWGPAGCGRTHLLRAVTQKDCFKSVYICNDNQVRTLEELSSQYEIFEEFPKIIAIDDVDRLSQKSQSNLFNLYNQWRDLSETQHAFALALSGNCSPLSLNIREDLRTRLAWDLVFQLKSLSDSEKSEALIAQSIERGLQKNKDVIDWILKHYDRDMRKLTSLLDALDRYSLSTGRHITIPLVRAMLAANSELHT